MGDTTKNLGDIYSCFSVKNKIVIVTGAARGNGLAISRGLVNGGARVYGIDVVDFSNSIKNENFFPIKADVTNADLMREVVDQIYLSNKKIDVLINNAGITKATSAESYAIQDWDKTILTNLSAPFILAQLVFGTMKDSGGSIINITSLNARFGFSNNPAYVASKSGLNGLTRALAKDWAKYNIRVNNICPGYIHTDMTKISFNDPVLFKERMDRSMIKRYGEPEDLVGIVIFLASEASSYITGADLFVDGGWSASGV